MKPSTRAKIYATDTIVMAGLAVVAAGVSDKYALMIVQTLLAMGGSMLAFVHTPTDDYPTVDKPVPDVPAVSAVDPTTITTGSGVPASDSNTHS